MITKVLDYVQKHRMIKENDVIVAGVSGGADSVCLLFVLLKIREKIPFFLAVAHVDHGIRKESGEDAGYVRELCEENGLPFYLTEVKIKEYAKESGLSEEEAGRKIRYQAFEEALQRELDVHDAVKRNNAGKIAVAHNSNDRAETMLFHLFRGTGLTGLCGIKPVSGKVIRPLLCLERKEIEEWLAGQGITYRIDSTNAQDIYTRNRIRHHILSYAEEEVHKGAVSHMNRTAEELSEAEEFIKGKMLSAKENCVSFEEQEGMPVIKIDIPKLSGEDDYLQGRILLSCFEDIAEGRKDISAAHVSSVRKLFKGNGSGRLHLPYGIIVYRKYNLGMIIRKKEGQDRKTDGLEKKPHHSYEVTAPCTLRIPGLGSVEITVFPYKKNENIPQKTYTKWFDYDKITKSIMFRVRKAGDYLTINSGLDHKSLQDYFINEKIPKEERDSFFVLADGAHILWVPGYRISEYYKISEDTLNIMQVEIKKDDT